MTHLPFIAASYGVAVLVPITFALTTWQRLRQAKRRLAALDTRRTGVGRSGVGRA